VRERSALGWWLIKFDRWVKKTGMPGRRPRHRDKATRNRVAGNSDHS